MEIEIEEPTEEQRHAGIVSEAVRMAARADWDSTIVAYLVAQNMPKDQAKSLLPEIRNRARPDLEKNFAGRRAIGWFFIFTGVVVFVWAWIQENKSIPGFIISLLPFIGGINQILKNQTPDDDELGID